MSVPVTIRRHGEPGRRGEGGGGESGGGGDSGGGDSGGSEGGGIAGGAEKQPTSVSIDPLSRVTLCPLSSGHAATHASSHGALFTHVDQCSGAAM